VPWVQGGAGKKLEISQSLRQPQTRPRPASPTRPHRRVMPPAACRLAEGLGGGAGPGRVWGGLANFLWLLGILYINIFIVIVSLLWYGMKRFVYNF